MKAVLGCSIRPNELDPDPAATDHTTDDSKTPW